MWTLADRIIKTIADVTIGTVIVLAHVALADRHNPSARQHRRINGERVWRTQISP